MRVLDPGHTYLLAQLDAMGEEQELVFVKRIVEADPDREEYPGTTCQEVIAALIDRVQFVHNEKQHHNNIKILHHLRMAYILFETRALERKVEKGVLRPEELDTDPHDGHIRLKGKVK